MGLIRSEQLYSANHDRASVERLAKAGWLHPLYDGVYAVGHTALTDEARYLAATFALWPKGALCHRSAAHLRRIAPPDDRIHIVVPGYNGHPHRRDIRIHRQALRPYEVEVCGGILCTTVCRTVMDLAASAPRLLKHAFEEAQIAHRLTPEEVATELVLRPGHRGTGRLRLLLADAVDPGAVQSRLELRFLQLCREFGLPRPLTQVHLDPWIADFYYPEERVVIETDGRRFHASRAKRRRDAQKTSDLEAQGEKVLRLRWCDVVDDAARTARLIDETLKARRVSSMSRVA